MGEKLGMKLSLIVLLSTGDCPFGIHSLVLTVWHSQHSAVPLKIKRLAQEPERFLWALSVAQSRCINKQIRIGALNQDSNMLVPYAG